MTLALKNRILGELLDDIDWADTLARTQDLQQHREDLLSRTIEFPETTNANHPTAKAVIVRVGKPPESIKPFNVLLNLNRLWDDLPDWIADMAGLLVEGSWLTQLAVVLRLARRLAGLTEYPLTRQHEVVVSALAFLRRCGAPVSVSTLVDACVVASRDNPCLPQLNRKQIEETLFQLEQIRCVKQEGAGWQLRESVLFLVAPA